MKKLMIAAAAAAMVSGAFAIGDAQVYDYTATLKTTACRAGKLSQKLIDYFGEARRLPSEAPINTFGRGDEIGIRKQVSVKIAGVIWGCDCPTIALPRFPRRTPGNYMGGYYFWNQQAETMFNPFRTLFFWNVLNRIDTMSKVEGSYTLACRQAGQRLVVFGGGFGSVSKTGCDTYVKSMNGNLAGFRIAADDEFGCVFCGGNNCVVTTLCDLCWDISSPDFVYTTGFSAVSGTWKIKYNKSMTKRLASTPWISRVYSFKKGGNTREVAELIDRAWARQNGRNYGAEYDCESVFGEVCFDVEDYLEKYVYEDVELDEFVDDLDEDDDAKLLTAISSWDAEQDAERDDEYAAETLEGFNNLVMKIALALDPS